MKAHTGAMATNPDGTLVFCWRLDQGVDTRSMADQVLAAQLASDGSIIGTASVAVDILAGAIQMWASGEVVGVFRTAWKRERGFLTVTSRRV